MNLETINNVYEQLGYQHLTYKINELSIPIDLKWKKIAVSVSGGADSALLSYLICSLIKESEVHLISHIRCWKTKPWQRNDAISVFQWLREKFPHISFYRHENFIPPILEWGNQGATLQDEYGKTVSGDIIEIQSFAEFVCYHNGIEAYYNAVTRNPENVEFLGMKKRDIDPDENNTHLLLMNHQNVTVMHPFRFVDKSWIVDTYKKLDILDLLDVTRSCEGIFKELDYKTYTPGHPVPTCGECFWCKEREWAIEQSK